VQQDAGAPISASFSRHQVVDTSAYAPATTIIIPAQKSRDHFGWTAPFQENEDQNDRSGLDLFAPKKVNVPTNNWNISNDKDSSFSKDENWTRSESEFSRSASGMMEREGDRSEDRLGSRFSDHSSSPAWIRTLDRGSKPWDGARQTAGASDNEDFRTLYQQQTSGFSQPNTLGSTDPLRGSPFASGSSRNDLPDESLRGQSEQQVVMQPSLVHAWDTLPSAAHPQRPRATTQPYVTQSRSPSTPAVLSFPKRPGDLFQ
jgi:hypothetical protein